MIKYFEKYATVAEYEAATKEYPHISYIEETEGIFYEAKPIPIPIDPYLAKPLTYKKEFGSFDGDTLVINFGPENPATGDCNTHISYSTDSGETWTDIEWQSDQSNPYYEFTVSGDEVWFKGDYQQIVQGGFQIFSNNDFLVVEGNIMSIIYDDDFVGQTVLPFGSGENDAPFQGFGAMIADAKNLRLPATTLTPYCYRDMFSNSSSLMAAPSILPATTLAEGCYAYMFQYCGHSDLIVAPELPATTLATGCYQYMFADSNIRFVKCLAPMQEGDEDTYAEGWLTGTPNGGTFVKSPNATWSELAVNGWTVYDYPLTGTAMQTGDAFEYPIMAFSFPATADTTALSTNVWRLESVVNHEASTFEMLYDSDGKWMYSINGDTYTDVEFDNGTATFYLGIIESNFRGCTSNLSGAPFNCIVSELIPPLIDLQENDDLSCINTEPYGGSCEYVKDRFVSIKIPSTASTANVEGEENGWGFDHYGSNGTAIWYDVNEAKWYVGKVGETTEIVFDEVDGDGNHWKTIQLINPNEPASDSNRMESNKDNVPFDCKAVFFIEQEPT